MTEIVGDRSSGQSPVATGQPAEARDDPEFLDRLRAGDQQAFSVLVRRHHRALIAVARPLVGESDAEEMVQMAWVKVHKAIASFEGRSALRTWLSRIVLNEARMWLRKHKREVLMDDLAGEDDGNPMADRFQQNGHWGKPPVQWSMDSPDDLLMGDQLADCLDRVLGEMPDNQRAMLEMRDAGDLGFDEICNILGISASNARVLLHRARGRLFKLVDHYQETGDC